MGVSINDSKVASRLLTHLGYGKQMVTFRQLIYKDMGWLVSTRTLEEEPVECIVAGSKAEGLSAPLESDDDIMFVPSNTVCTEDPGSLPDVSQLDIFELHLEQTAPGYTQLNAVKLCEPTSDLLLGSLVEFSPRTRILSSDKWKHRFKEITTQNSNLTENIGFQEVDKNFHGPSISTNVCSMFPADWVYALKCFVPSCKRSWASRNRPYQWPSVDIIQDVSNLEAHVVPVGNLFSCTQFLEWRICFTKAEIMLVQSLNDCLTKVFVLLKNIAKSTLKPLSKDMTTYTIKNIILWLAERNNYDLFTENNLMPVLKLALLLLKQCITGNYLPSYMIPERNLLSGRLTVEQRGKLCRRIDFLMNEGPTVIFRWMKAKDAFCLLIRSPDEFSKISYRRHRLQTLYIFFENILIRNFLKHGKQAEELARTACVGVLFLSFMQNIDIGKIDKEAVGEIELELNLGEIEEDFFRLRPDARIMLVNHPINEYLT